jgi:hypothetical protein
MKVIGIVDNDTYLMQVSHTEIEKFMNMYYGKCPRLKVLESIDLSKGYDFAREIKDSMTTTRDFIKANKAIIEAILNGIAVLNRTEEMEAKK